MVFVLAGNKVLRPLVRWVDCRPIVSNDNAAVYRIHALCNPDALSLPIR